MIRFFQDKVVGFHVGLGCKPKPHMQGLAASDVSWSTDNGVLFCWLPCWFPAFGEVTMGKVLRPEPPGAEARGAEATGTHNGFQVRFPVDPAGDTCSRTSTQQWKLRAGAGFQVRFDVTPRETLARPNSGRCGRGFRAPKPRVEVLEPLRLPLGQRGT